MIKINKEYELSRFNLSQKWNDFIAVQKEVISSLRQEGYFDNTNVINKKTGMIIRVTTKGIKESLGAGKRFQSLQKK